MSIGVESAWLGCAYLRPTYFAPSVGPKITVLLGTEHVIVGGKALQRANSLSNHVHMPVDDHRYAWKRTVAYHVILELSGRTPCFLLANAVMEEGFPSMGVCLPFAAICAHICAPYCNRIRLECSCSFCGAKRWNATLQLVLGAVNSSWKCRICCHGRIIPCIRI
jgi:hypothetical protein